MKKSHIAMSMAATALCACSTKPIVYPTPPQDSTVVDNYFGTEVADIYRPLENDTAQATLEWVKAENEVTESYLSTIPFRGQIRERLTRLSDYKKTGLPWRDNDSLYYFYANDGLQNQSVLYRSTTPGGKAEVFLDPNKLSDDGTVALTETLQSPTGELTLYTISRNGSDWSEIYVMDTKTGKLLEDHIEWAKFPSPQWWRDGFFYSAYPTPEEGKEYSNANADHQIYYHKIGTPQSADRLVYSDPAHPLHFHSAYVPQGEDLLFIYGGGEGFGASLMMKNLAKENSEWEIIEPSQDFEIGVVGVTNGELYILTNSGAENYRLMKAPVSNPMRSNWTELIPETESVLTNVSFCGPDKMIVSYMKDASDHTYIYTLDGKQLSEIKMPTFGSTGVWSSKKYPDDVFYSFTSFTYPSECYSYNPATKESKLLTATEIEGFNPEEYVTEQVFYNSSDGTRIPMFITHKKGIKLDGSNPTLLYGYGGFNISLTPGFSAMRLFWLENGGVYAQPNLRGGGEYGHKWHEAGTKMQKMNVFNDFIAAAEYLIEKGYTTPEKLAIEGGSNGGLLIGATVNLRPELFKVAIPEVGVMDMMRYHLFTIGWNWAPDYGTSADSKEMADYLMSYSPLHTIRNDGTPYPAILVTTADHDDRVVPAHSFKYAAALQAADTGNAPKLIRIDSKAGHGGGKPLSKVIDEKTDVYSFIMNNMGIKPEKK